ncbi:MAG TPA: phosphatase PAP2 family protein [Bryobacteraceae bacterium]|nr:phosphatase PAP2 family protein [Bryobacteraceae bacterium]
MKLRLRSAEWLLVIYFGYVAAIAARFRLGQSFVWRPLLAELLVCALFLALAYGEAHEHAELFSIMRDWVPVALLLVAYHEMDWFSSLPRNFDLELRWVQWDRSLFYPWGLQRALESLGALGPLCLELCYLLVYAVAPFVVAVLYFQHRRKRVNGALFLYLLGTLLSYALFPYFPSDPPRIAFAGSDVPHIVTPVRELNLWLVGDFGIHSSVFPSAHVSSAFSAAWALFAFLPERKQFGWVMLLYAVSVTIATVYGRYHYGADALAGIAISLAPAAMILLARRLRRVHGLLGLP